ncbi:TauD/TfdA family dioxygenase [Streptomyces sp. NBC_00144]|uniref:TauD/TfdA family dioxygenase n=1 Tax=Streptomyces sp. NBC_00144 TaxID=2975665 RepID=UPI00324499A3
MTDQPKCAQRPAPESATTTTSGIRTTELAAPASWTSRDLSELGQWSFELTARHIDELSSALEKVRRQGVPLLRLTSDHFPLPTLAVDLQRPADTLENGCGFAVIKGLPVQQYSESDIKTIFWGLGQHLGVPVSQDAGGHLVTKGRRGNEYPYRVVPLASRSADGLRFRTGGSDAVALLCTSGGGRRSMASSTAIYNQILRERPELIQRMYRPFCFDRHGEHCPEEFPYRSVPLACWFAGRLSIRYARAQLESAQRFPEVPRLEPLDVELFDLIDALANSQALRVDVAVEAGDIELYNNYHVLHTHLRPAGHGGMGPGEQYRLWLTLRHGRPLPPDYVWETRTPGEGLGRGGVSPRDVIALN